ncbi:hypothetical protein [Mucilaginibacter gossypii]|uniref:hypothetical protein n=1 Tax=Mucilaginibacter gossypii TaxID=551996 RepID=UPI00210F0F46|nr:hypothetical protein [Mucilaginibacter gossypii]
MSKYSLCNGHGTRAPAKAFSKTDEMKELVDADTSDTHTLHLHLKAKQLLDNGRVMDAWKALLM